MKLEDKINKFLDELAMMTKIRKDKKKKKEKKKKKY